MGARRPEGMGSAPGGGLRASSCGADTPRLPRPRQAASPAFPPPLLQGSESCCAQGLTTAGGGLTPKPSLSHLSFPVSRGEGQGPPAGWAWLLRWVRCMPGRLGREGKRRPRPLKDWGAGPGPGREERLPPGALAGVCGGWSQHFRRPGRGRGGGVVLGGTPSPVDAPVDAGSFTPRGSGSPWLP